MDQVSKLLENILVVEEPDTNELKGHDRRGSEPDIKRISVSSTEQLESGFPAQLAQAPQYSSFWYLDDDPLKAPNQLSEKLMERMLKMIIPEVEPSTVLEGRMEMHKTRPPFSVNLMLTNSTQLAQKSSFMFEMTDTLLMVVGWYNPFLTVGTLMIITHLILNPYLVSVIPSLFVMKKFLIPSYLKLYPPDPTLIDGLYTLYNPVPYDGPPLAKFEAPKVCSQYSREFLMNFADMQNFQVGYIRLYDVLVDWGQHYFLFEDQKLSSVVYLTIMAMTVMNLFLLPTLVPLILQYFPFKFMSVTSVWCLIGACHPVVKEKILDKVHSEDARLSRLDYTDKMENLLMKCIEDENLQDEVREVQIFELHILDLRKMWKPVGFTSTFYALSHPSRILAVGDSKPSDKDESLIFHDEEDDDDEANTTMDRSTVMDGDKDLDSHITRKATLGEVKPPRQWTFCDKLWSIDLEPEAWVQENCIMDLVSVDTDEKWVYDFVDGADSPDGKVYRRRRWTRGCKRERAGTIKKPEPQSKQ